MAIDPKLLVIKPVNELESVTGLQSGDLLFYDKTNPNETVLKKMSIDTFNNLSKTAKPLKPNDATPTTEGLYKPTTSGVYSNAGGLVAQDGYFTLFFFDGITWTKTEDKMPESSQNIPQFENLQFPVVNTSTEKVQTVYDSSIWQLADGQTATIGDVPGVSDKWVLKSRDVLLEKTVYDFSAYSNISTTNASNANSTNLTALNDFPSPKTGIISKIKGRFPEVGILKIFIANNKRNASSPFVFKTVKIFDVPISLVGLNEIDVSSLNIPINIGDYVGVSTASTSKPYFGTDSSVGFGWYQNTVTPVEGNDITLSYVANATFAFSFEVREVKLLSKTEGATKTELTSKADKTDVFFFEKQYTLPISTGGAVAALLGNNIPADKDGFIKRIRLISNSAGIVRFQLFERVTSKSTGTAGSTDNFKAKETFDLSVISGDNTYDLPTPKSVKKGDYLFITAQTGTVSPLYSSAVGITHLGWWQGTNTPKVNGTSYALTYQIGSILFEYWVESDIFQKKNDIKINTITATRNAGNYNSIRDIVKNISDASETNQYIVKVPAGTWQEVDLRGKKWVKVVGDLNGKTIIELDPLGTMASKVLPADYYYASEAGKTINTVNKVYLHIAFPTDDSYYENITFIAKDSKYALHIDNPAFKNFTAINCRVYEINCSYPVGMGIWAGQNILFDNCIFETGNISTTNPKKGIFYHNWNNQSQPNTLTINRSKFKNCDFAVIDELGSNQVDKVNILNCFTTVPNKGNIHFMVDKNSGGNTYWKPDGINNEPNPVNVPYCIALNTTGTKILTVTSDDSGSFNSSWAGIPQRDTAKILEESIIQIG